MDWNWLQSLLFGFISGFAEFLPISSDAHQYLLGYFMGSGNELLGFRLFCHISVLAALLFSSRFQLKRLSRERRIAAAPLKRRKRQPDRNALLDLRLLKTAVIPIILAFAASWYTQCVFENLWALALVLIVNGILLYVPQFFPSGNKESQAMSALDALLIGFGGALAVVPGISRVGILTSVGQLRGADGRYCVDIALLLCIPALLILIGFDIYGLYLAQSVLAVSLFFSYLFAAAAAFAGAYFGILLLRFLAVKTGFSGFAYYCWGVALLTFALYLTI